MNKNKNHRGKKRRWACPERGETKLPRVIKADWRDPEREQIVVSFTVSPSLRGGDKIELLRLAPYQHARVIGVKVLRYAPLGLEFNVALESPHRRHR